MKHPAATIDYAMWIVQAIATLLIATYLYWKTSKQGVNEGLIRKLILLIIVESCFTVVFEFTFAFGAKKTLNNVVTSFTIGGEETLKGFSLCLFAFKYLDASFESP